MQEEIVLGTKEDLFKNLLVSKKDIDLIKNKLAFKFIKEKEICIRKSKNYEIKKELKEELIKQESIALLEKTIGALEVTKYSDKDIINTLAIINYQDPTKQKEESTEPIFNLTTDKLKELFKIHLLFKRTNINLRDFLG